MMPSPDRLSSFPSHSFRMCRGWINSSIAFDGDERGETDKLVIGGSVQKDGDLYQLTAIGEKALLDDRARVDGLNSSRRQHHMKKKQSSRGRKQDRARVAGGQDYEVKYAAKK